MKREFVAVFIVVAILTLSLINIRYIETKTQALSSDIETAEKLFLKGDNDGATARIEDSLSIWLDWDSYSHIMLRHSEIDIITDAYFELLSALEAEEGVTEAAFERLSEQLRSILIKERVTLGSVL